MIEPLCTVEGIDVFQDPQSFKSGQPGRVHYVADMSVDVDGAEQSYRLDNSIAKGALDDIRYSAGYPDSSWWNVLTRDPKNPDKPFVDENGFCVSRTSYEREGFSTLDRRRYLDALTVPYAVPPGKVRRLCRGVLLGCKAKITDVVNGRSIECVTGDFSGNRIGEASLFAARFFDPTLSARNGDDRKRYLYEYWPGVPAVLNGETFKLIPA
jgi:hypothetical protein